MNRHAAWEAIRSRFTGTLETGVPLSKYSYYRIGGAAEFVATPKSLGDLELLHHFVLDTQVPFFILGWGSNLLFSDDGYSGLIIRMKQLFLESEVEGEGILRIGASVGSSTLLRKAQDQGWGKLAHFTGIPGSIGGMVKMNAGTHLGEMKDSCMSVEYVALGKDSAFSPVTHTTTEKSFSYRHNYFLTDQDIVLHARLKFTAQDPALVKKEIDDLYQRRKQTQPVDFPSCGSVFMNPKEVGKHAWQVIDSLGLRGHQIGDAQISEKHSNFIINRGAARASDVKALIHLVKTRAQTELGITLNEEVKIL